VERGEWVRSGSARAVSATPQGWSIERQHCRAGRSVSSLRFEEAGLCACAAQCRCVQRALNLHARPALQLSIVTLSLSSLSSVTLTLSLLQV
jgi:hypothetical protein